MPSKKKKYNARFPPARIKKIMQSDEEVGKVAQAVPVIISRALELFVESLLKKAETVTQARNAKTLTPSHLKQCIMAEQRFDFLKDLVATVPDVQGDEDLAETPRSAASNSAFVYPPVPSTSAASSALGAPPSESSYSQPEPDISQHNDQSTVETNQVHPGYIQQSQQKSVIVTQQTSQPSYILNPPGITSNPYIPSLSGPSHPGSVHPIHPHTVGSQFNYIPNPNGMNFGPSQPQPSGSGVIVYDNKNISHHYQPH